MAEVGRYLLLIIPAEGVIGVVKVVLAGEHVDAFLPQLPHAGDTSLNWLVVEATHERQADVRVTRDANLGFPHQVHDFVGMCLIVGGQRLTMARRDSPLITFAYRLYG